MKWHEQRGALAGTRLGELKLGVAVIAVGGRWGALAIESDGFDERSILEHHSHDVMGEYDTKAEAQRACEKYARAWRRRRRIAASAEVERPCGCGTIDAEFPPDGPPMDQQSGQFSRDVPE